MDFQKLNSHLWQWRSESVCSVYKIERLPRGILYVDGGEK